MKKEIEKHSVISLSDESFKHYLIQRFSDDLDGNLATPDGWIRLYNHAREEMQKSGGRITAYEVVDDVLVSHERINTLWPINWMWVLQFNND